MKYSIESIQTNIIYDPSQLKKMTAKEVENTSEDLFQDHKVFVS